jgi:hypothetical protein
MDVSMAAEPRSAKAAKRAEEVVRPGGAQADSQTTTPLMPSYRSQQLTSTYGGVAQRWALIDSEHRCLQAQHAVDKQWRQQSDHDVKAFKSLCRTALPVKPMPSNP